MASKVQVYRSSDCVSYRKAPPGHESFNHVDGDPWIGGSTTRSVADSCNFKSTIIRQKCHCLILSGVMARYEELLELLSIFMHSALHDTVQQHFHESRNMLLGAKKSSLQSENNAPQSEKTAPQSEEISSSERDFSLHRATSFSSERKNHSSERDFVASWSEKTSPQSDKSSPQSEVCHSTER